MSVTVRVVGVLPPAVGDTGFELKLKCRLGSLEVAERVIGVARL